MYRSLLFILLFTGLNPRVVFAQENFTSFLQDRLRPIKEEMQHSLGMVEEIDFKSPLVKEFQIRTNTDQFKLDQQRYELRTKFSSPKIKKYEQQTIELLKQEYVLEASSFVVPEIAVIYEEWLDLYAYHIDYKLSSAVMSFHEDRLRLLEIASDGKFSVYKIIEAKQDLEKVRWELENTKAKIEGYIFDDNSMITVDQLSLFVQDIGNNSSFYYEDHNRDMIEMEKIKTEYLLEEAENNQVVDFVGVEYRGPQADPWSDKISLGLALRIPTSKKKQIDLVELKIEESLELEKQKSEQLRFESFVERQYKQLIDAIQSFKEQKMLQSRLEKYHDLTIDQKPTTIDEIDDWLDLQIKHAKIENDVLEARLEVYEEYTDWLDETGLLSQHYDTDFFSASILTMKF